MVLGHTGTAASPRVKQAVPDAHLVKPKASSPHLATDLRFPPLAASPPSLLATGQILRLQQSAGNRAVQRVLAESTIDRMLNKSDQPLLREHIKGLIEAKGSDLSKEDGKAVYLSVGSRSTNLDSAKKEAEEELERRSMLRNFVNILCKSDLAQAPKVYAAAVKSKTDLEEAKSAAKLAWAEIRQQAGKILTLEEINLLKAAQPVVSPDAPFTLPEVQGILNAALSSPDPNAHAHLADNVADARKKAAARSGEKAVTTVYVSLAEATDDLMQALNQAQASGKKLRSTDTSGGAIKLGRFATVASRTGLQGDSSGIVTARTWNLVDVDVARGMFGIPRVVHFTPN